MPGSFSLMQPSKKIYYTTLLVIFIGITLSLIQFLYNRSIWFDEAMLSLNIINRNYVELLKPLDHLQVAPIGFLWVEKFFSLLIVNSEYGLRIFPLLCFWASIYFFYKITIAVSKNHKITLLAVSLFCLNASLLYYSSEVKQYMLDVFICLLLYFFLLKEYKNNSNRYILLAFFGSISVFLSNISVILLFTIALYLANQQSKKSKPNYLSLIILFISWAITFGFYYFRFIHNHPNKNGMLSYWGNSFMPLNIFDITFWDFCFYKTKMVFGSLLSFGIAGLLPFIFFIIGLYKLIKDKHRKILFLLLFPTLLQLTLSAFKLYPFDLRLVLYQAGFYMIITSTGVLYIVNLSIQKTKQTWIYLLPLIFPVIVCATLLKNYPAKEEEIKQSVQFISKNIKPNETIYVYYGAIRAFEYYTQTGKINVKNPIIFGNGYRGSNQKYVEEIKNNKQKCWILFSHIFDNENKYITTSLDSIYKKDLSYKAYGSEAYLYDMSK
jgi:hypothetical protein